MIVGGGEGGYVTSSSHCVVTNSDFLAEANIMCPCETLKFFLSVSEPESTWDGSWPIACVPE